MSATHGLPHPPTTKSKAITLRNTLEIEPAYWRCSNPLCNPDGEQGWLRPLRAARVLDRSFYDGLTSIQIANKFRSRLGFLYGQPPSDPPTPLPGSVPFPDAGRPTPTLPDPSPAPSSPPCSCMQTHSSILYNAYKVPVGLLGGLCFFPERLTPAAWSCGAHYADTLPRAFDLVPGGGCSRCPPAIRQAGPVKESFVVNAWGEYLLAMDTERYYMVPAGREGGVVTLPHAGASSYENGGPLTAHLQQLSAVQVFCDAKARDKFVRRVERMLPAGMEGVVEDILADRAEEQLSARVMQLRVFCDGWCVQQCLLEEEGRRMQ